MPHLPQRNIRCWRCPTGCYFRCVAVALYDAGYRDDDLLSEFERMIPDWPRFFDGKINRNAIVKRAERGRRHPCENPEKHPLLSHVWSQAVQDVRQRRTWTYEQLRRTYGAP